MTAPEPTPTAEQVDAVARALSLDPRAFTESTYGPGGARVMASRFAAIDRARRILTTTDPAARAALAASLPAEVKAASMTDAEMLAALVDRGTLTGEVAIRYEKPLATPDMDGTTVRTYTTQVTEVTAEAAMKVKAPLGATGHRIVRRVASDWREVAP